MRDILFAYSAESIYNQLTQENKSSIHKIYPLLSELVEKNKIRIINDTAYPLEFAYQYEKVDIFFYIMPGGGTAIFNIRTL